MEHSKTEHHDVHAGEKLGVYLLIYAALMVLLVITVVVAEYDLGILNTVVAMAVAVIKAALVILFFMHVRHGTKLISLAVCASFFWLGIFIVFTFVDYGGMPSNPPNGGRTAGDQAGLLIKPSESPNSQPEFRNPLRPLIP
jgi:cytochrome c oxidase subunit 4